MNAYQFFLKHAGYSYNPQTQSPMQGRIQGARRLAAAERKARDSGDYIGPDMRPSMETRMRAFDRA